MKRKKLISAKTYKRISFILSLVFVAENTFLPIPALASANEGADNISGI